MLGLTVRLRRVTVVETFTCTQVWELKEVRVSTVWTCSVGHWSQRQGLPWTEGWPRVTCCVHLDSLSGWGRCWVMLSEIPPLWQSVGRKWGVRAARWGSGRLTSVQVPDPQLLSALPWSPTVPPTLTRLLGLSLNWDWLAGIGWECLNTSVIFKNAVYGGNTCF